MAGVDLAGGKGGDLLAVSADEAELAAGLVEEGGDAHGVVRKWVVEHFEARSRLSKTGAVQQHFTELLMAGCSYCPVLAPMEGTKHQTVSDLRNWGPTKAERV